MIESPTQQGLNNIGPKLSAYSSVTPSLARPEMGNLGPDMYGSSQALTAHTDLGQLGQTLAHVSISKSGLNMPQLGQPGPWTTLPFTMLWSICNVLGMA